MYLYFLMFLLSVAHHLENKLYIIIIIIAPPRTGPPGPGPPGQVPPTPPPTLNPPNVANTCYAVACSEVMHSIGLQNYLLPGQTPVEMNLTNHLRTILNGSRSSPDLVPLVMALNMCLPPQSQFVVGRQQCAGEFLSCLFSSLTLRQHFSTFEDQAICPVCSVIYTANLPHAITPHVLLIPPQVMFWLSFIFPISFHNYTDTIHLQLDLFTSTFCCMKPFEELCNKLSSLSTTLICSYNFGIITHRTERRTFFYFLS